jgi:hypothetical protein
VAAYALVPVGGVMFFQVSGGFGVCERREKRGKLLLEQLVPFAKEAVVQGAGEPAAGTVLG